MPGEYCRKSQTWLVRNESSARRESESVRVDAINAPWQSA